MDEITTTKKQMIDVLKKTKEKSEDIICFYQPAEEENTGFWDSEERKEPIKCSVDELPTRKFDCGYGGVQGESFIAFGKKYVYVKVEYDGSEWIEAVPRHPEYVTRFIPCLGGG
ncbi:MAG: hypothetical protein ACOC80_13065 [Petrotogales bacterium]